VYEDASGLISLHLRRFSGKISEALLNAPLIHTLRAAWGSQLSFNFEWEFLWFAEQQTIRSEALFSDYRNVYFNQTSSNAAK